MGFFYMVSFMLVERSDVKIHIIHSLADDKIPFCPYFIIPYVMWYFFLIRYSGLFRAVLPARRNIISILALWQWELTLFILVSYVYPNGQNLRPDLTGESGILFQRSDFCIR